VVKDEPLVKQRPAAKSRPPAKVEHVAKAQPLAKPQPPSKTRSAEPVTGRGDDPFIAEARRKVDAMSAEVAAQERKHKRDLARFERERQDLERRLEELRNVERRFETLKRHLDGSLTWRLGGGLRSALRAWRKLGRSASKGA
jgi:translation initiation factor IF-2